MRRRIPLLGWMVIAALAGSLAQGEAAAAEGEAPAPTAAAPARAAGDAAALEQTPRVEARLVSDVDSMVPGGSFRVGVQFTIAPDWHMYWIYPGDVGLPTEVHFEGPDGVDFGELRWPTPHRIESSNGLVSYGYADSVLPWSTVRAPAGLLEGEKVTLTARVRWLVCAENCIPGQAQLALTLPVESTARPSAAAPSIDAAATLVPGELPPDVRVRSELSTTGVAPGESFEAVFLIESAGSRSLADAEFFPAPADGLDTTSVRTETSGAHVPDGGLLIRVAGAASTDPARTGDRLDGVLRVGHGASAAAWELSLPVPRLPLGQNGAPVTSGLFATAPPAPRTPPPPKLEAAPVTTPPAEVGPSLMGMLLFALLGGLILNVMPCVLPVLSIKVLGLVQQADDDRRSIWYHGLAYTVGILASFAVLGIILIAAKASGEAVGWGFQFQEPAFVAAMGALVFAFGLSLFGVFEVELPGAHHIDAKAARHHGYTGSFMNGVLATLLATPCTAPFLAPALGFALAQPPAILLVFLLTIGFGLALPFLVLAAMPAWARHLPKPGPWMGTFKKAMGFLLMATTVWLVDVLSGQWDRTAMTHYLGFLTLLAFAAWIYGHWGNHPFARNTRVGALIVAVALVAGGAVGLLRPAQVEVGDIAWKDFTQVDVEAMSQSGKTVFIDFTADWCVTCKVYERTVINTDPVKGALAQGCVLPVRADYTKEDPRITHWLERFKRPGVPMYVILPAGRPHEPLLLPDVLTESSLLEGLIQAGPATDCPT
ncbi:MAG: thioredoxin family protein [Deltaproteobacteria bacterium]|nr:thioredoxin family protein [Deltaproteobacteria bacterium]MCB9789130.1 thioredoxin family protein [Deltaproteobacteria bacterium]